MIRSLITGFTSFSVDYSYIMSNYDGSDSVENFMREVVVLREDRSAWYQPIKFYIVGGELGMLHAEQVIVYVYGGIPFILSSTVSIDGSDERNAQCTSDGEQFIGSMFARGNSDVFSIGYIDGNRRPVSYANEFLKKNALMPTDTIDAGITNSMLVSAGNTPSGTIFVPGGHRYDVYAVDESVSRSIRPMKDFRFNPVEEHGVPDGMREVLLVGGFPEIVPVGSLCSVTGDMFNVWVPNDKMRYADAEHIMKSEWLPHDVFDIDVDELSESYAMMAVYANDTDVSNHIDDDETDDAPPDMLSGR